MGLVNLIADSTHTRNGARTYAEPPDGIDRALLPPLMTALAGRDHLRMRSAPVFVRTPTLLNRHANLGADATQLTDPFNIMQEGRG